MRSIVFMLTIFGLMIHAIFGCCVHALCVSTPSAKSVESTCSCGEASHSSSAVFDTASDVSHSDGFMETRDLSPLASSFERSLWQEEILCGRTFQQISDRVDFHASCHTHSHCVFPNDGQRQNRSLITTSLVSFLNLVALPFSERLPTETSRFHSASTTIFPYVGLFVSRYAMWQRFLF